MQHDVTRLRNIAVVASGTLGSAPCRAKVLDAIGPARSSARASEDSSPPPSSSSTWTARSGLFADEPTSLAFVTEGFSVVDGALVVLERSRGAVDRAEAALRDMQSRRVPCVVFVDDLGTPEDLVATVERLESDLRSTTLALHVPWVGERGLHVIDVLEQRLVVESSGGARELLPVPAAARSVVARLRERIVDFCAELDESIQGASSVGLDIGACELGRALRRATLAGSSRVLLVTCGSLRARRGLGLLLDALVAYLPSPKDRPPVLGVDPHRAVAVARFARESDAFSARVFATTEAPEQGRLVWIRVHSGSVAAGSAIRLLPRDVKVHATRIFAPDARGLVEIEAAGPGAVVCIDGMHDARPGDTLSCARAPIVLDELPSS